MKKYTDEWFKNKIYSKRNDIEILNEYKNKHSDMQCKCKKHPHFIFTVRAATLSSGGGKCDICMFESQKLYGKKFGRLTVIGLDEERSLLERKAYWLCKCNCGKEESVSVLQASLLNGNTKSCGCTKTEAMIKYNKIYKTKKNIYKIEDNIVIGKCYNKDVEFILDLEDFDKIKDYCWFEDGHGYVNARAKDVDKTIKMHRLILGLDFGDTDIVDHINHNGLDNRKINLRICDKSKNAMNAEIQSNNVSGVCGVSYDKEFDGWRAYITKNNKRYDLGIYKKIDDAIESRKVAEDSLFGEYSYDNSQLTGKSYSL